MKKEILIIDDNEKLCKSLIQNFDQFGYISHYANNEKEAMQLIEKNKYKTIILDVVIGDESGFDILKKIKAFDNKLPVIMITGYGTIEIAVKSIKIGAYDFVQKPLDFERLLKIVENAINMSSLIEENIILKKQLNTLSPRMITQNKKMLELLEKIKKVAPTDIPILIHGENGTGKELLADFIHKNSKNRAKEMIKINCAAFPENLLDNELFGHEKGSFTGAETSFIGVFEKADRGTLLLDEIGDMSLATQAKILRTLQNKEIRRIGGEKTIKVDVRFIASTNKNLEKIIKEKQFREDLFYRLNAATFHIPPLREKKDDIPLLINYFLEEFSKSNSKIVDKATDSVLNLFFNYNWPGNIRELRNVINYAAAITSKDYISIEDLPSTFGCIDSIENSSDIMIETEKNLILKILNKTNYNKKRTAEILKISRKTLYNKLEKYAIKTEN